MTQLGGITIAAGTEQRMGLPEEARGKKKTKNQLTCCEQEQENCTDDPQGNYSWIVLTLSSEKPTHNSISGVPVTSLPGCQAEEEDAENCIPFQHI